MIARIRNHHVSGLREGLLDLGGDRRVHRGEQQRGALPGLHSSTVRSATASGVPPPRCHVSGVRVLLAGGAVAGAEPRQLEPRMALQKLDEVLAHHAGGAEDTDFDFVHLL